MISMKLSQLAEIINAELILSSSENQTFTGVSTDTRTLETSNLFFAISGPNFKGADFIKQALEKGASAVVTDTKVNIYIPQLIVTNTTQALGQLAAYYRRQFKIPIIAITGTSGKTTTKDLLANILLQNHNVLYSEKTYNNDIGLPLTIFKLNSQHEFSVLEIGTNHPGEIANLTQIAKPTIAAITMIGPGHLEFLKTLDGVAEEKSAIYSTLKSDNIAIINQDDKYFEYLKKQANKSQIKTFGLHSEADIQVKNIRLNIQSQPSFDLCIKQDTKNINLQLLGEHNVMNALAAACIADTLNISIDEIKSGLENTTAIQKRLATYQLANNILLIDDSYNATPNSVVASLKLLANYMGEKIFVFGGMTELGANAEQEHVNIGKVARELEIDNLYAIGPLSQSTVTSFGEGGYYFQSKSDLIQALQTKLISNQTLLIKGSRASKMEEVVEVLIEK